LPSADTRSSIGNIIAAERQRSLQILRAVRRRSATAALVHAAVHSSAASAPAPALGTEQQPRCKTRAGVRLIIGLNSGVGSGTTRRHTWSHVTTSSKEQYQCSASVKIKHRRQNREVRRISASLHRALHHAQQRTAIASHASAHFSLAALHTAAAPRASTHGGLASIRIHAALRSVLSKGSVSAALL